MHICFYLTISVFATFFRWHFWGFSCRVNSVSLWHLVRANTSICRELVGHIADSADNSFAQWKSPSKMSAKRQLFNWENECYYLYLSLSSQNEAIFNSFMPTCGQDLLEKYRPFHKNISCFFQLMSTIVFFWAFFQFDYNQHFLWYWLHGYFQIFFLHYSLS